jgi:hypothetical protein
MPNATVCRSDPIFSSIASTKLSGKPLLQRLLSLRHLWALLRHGVWAAHLLRARCGCQCVAMSRRLTWRRLLHLGYLFAYFCYYRYLAQNMEGSKYLGIQPHSQFSLTGSPVLHWRHRPLESPICSNDCASIKDIRSYILKCSFWLLLHALLFFLSMVYVIPRLYCCN